MGDSKNCLDNSVVLCNLTLQIVHLLNDMNVVQPQPEGHHRVNQAKLSTPCSDWEVFLHPKLDTQVQIGHQTHTPLKPARLIGPKKVLFAFSTTLN